MFSPQVFPLRMGFVGDSVVKNLPANAGDGGFSGLDPWVRKIPWRRKWQPTPGFLPGKSHGHRSLECYSPWSWTWFSDYTTTTSHFVTDKRFPWTSHYIVWLLPSITCCSLTHGHLCMHDVIEYKLLLGTEQIQWSFLVHWKFPGGKRVVIVPQIRICLYTNETCG